MSFLGNALNVISGGLQVAGAVSSLTQENKEEKRARDAAQQQAALTTEDAKRRNALAWAQVLGRPEYQQYFEPYLENIRQQQQAALRLAHRQQAREALRRAGRGELSTREYGTVPYDSELRDAIKERQFYGLDYPSQVLARQQTVAQLLQGAANTGLGYPSAATAAGGLQQDVRSQNAAGLPLLGEAIRDFGPTFEDILGGQSSGAPYSTAGSTVAAPLSRNTYGGYNFPSTAGLGR
jgi:hypothetical protein